MKSSFCSKTTNMHLFCCFRAAIYQRFHELTNTSREVLRSLRVPGIPRLPAMHIWNRTPIWSILLDLYGPANAPGPQMIPVPQMIPKLDRNWSQDRKWSPDYTANDLRNGNGILTSPQIREMSGLRNLESGFISSIFFLKLPTANLNATGSVGSTSKVYSMWTV